MAGPTIGTTGEGETTTNSTSPTVLTTTVNGAWVFGCATDWQALGNGTSTDVSEAATPTDLSILAVRKSAATSTAGTGVTLNFDAAGTGNPDLTWSAIEIVPSAGGTLAIDASTPALASGVDDPWATGSFTAPEDALLVVAVMGDDFNGSGSTNPTITPTSSGLTFTERVRRYGGETTGSPDVPFGLTGFWTAPVTAGQGVSRTVSTTTSNTFDAGGIKVYVVTESASVAQPLQPSKVSDRGTVANVTAATTSALTLTSPTSIAVNNYLIARVAVDNSGTSGAAPGCTVTDPRSNTWTVLGPALADPGAAAAGATAYLCYAKVTTAYQAADALTFNWGGVSTTAKAVVVEEWANIHRITPVPGAAATNNSVTAGSTTAVSLSGSATTPNQLVYICLATEGIAADTVGADSDTTNGTWAALTTTASADATATNNQRVSGAYKVVTAAGAQSWDSTITSRDWAAVGAAFAVDEELPAVYVRPSLAVLQRSVW